MQLNHARGVVFDLWRTIVDPGGPRYAARVAVVLNERARVAVTGDDVARALEERGHLRHAVPIDELNDDMWRAFTGTAARAADLSVLRDQHRRFVHHARMIPGASQLLDELQHRGVEVAVVSNATIASDAVVERLVMAERVPHVALSCHTGYAKPDPRAFRVVTERWGFEPADVCVVGDKWETDIAGAVAAGMTSLKIGGDLRSEPGLLAVVHDLADVSAMLGMSRRSSGSLVGARA